MILQHQADAPPGLLLDGLEDAGVRARVVRVDRNEPLPAPEATPLAVSLGSDRSADDGTLAWIGRELEWLRAADRAGTAILGLCFGGQALACALGGGVARATLPERGWVEIATDEPELVAPGPWLTWHDDVIVAPPDADVIARTESGPQTFRAGRHLGVQFHPEATAEIYGDWLRSARDAGVDSDEVLGVGEAVFARAAAGARRLFAGFLAPVTAAR